ncbi:UDP-N-acetylglucosamine 1-carboxyvinyltransferase [Candidatus Formimonas warabiya]|uniref:UDP-N-acetylglucosamine 1-carboxyvinyltransferase n=1 Tax=Formimonas warabiya TaxID=1761012 RepID=A0A3G1KUL3_FORW1|nr:UDP-N-acetylglucosamine 1-carboxyvinyltransferase [Candidatus Formimonas warabiya]ATW26193.1 UDP-N-acetylglucosamine 1-carboxyvinyltransferase [Candidatus Formimonas warabiya]
MSRLIIKGPSRLEGSIKISGAKNAALAIISASLLAEGETVLENVPQIQDVMILSDILSSLGVDVCWMDEEILRLRVPEEIDHVATYYQVKRLRASNLLLGALLARKRVAEISLPGGCQIGSRPMDLHIKGLTQLGCQISIEHGYIKASRSRMRGARIYLDFPSVGATENIMIAAAVAEGQTILENVAKEPEIVDLASFLNALGAKIRGAGTDVIKITGVKRLQGTRYGIIPDRIEAGTFMVGAAITRGNILVENVIPTHIKPVSAKLQEAGVYIEENDLGIRVIGPETIKPIDVKTLPYPGFPTDMQSQMMALLALAEGTSMIMENVFENRLQLAHELKRMGAKIKVEGRTAVILGVEKLYGASVKALDLRAGAALVLAALAAEGQSEVHNLESIDRGYLNIERKLSHLGADIMRAD